MSSALRALSSARKLMQKTWISISSMADLHNDVTYEGWGKTSAAGHRECMENSKSVLERFISLLHGKTDRLHALVMAT